MRHATLQATPSEGASPKPAMPRPGSLPDITWAGRFAGPTPAQRPAAASENGPVSLRRHPGAGVSSTWSYYSYEPH